MDKPEHRAVVGAVLGYGNQGSDAHSIYGIDAAEVDEDGRFSAIYSVHYQPIEPAGGLQQKMASQFDNQRAADPTFTEFENVWVYSKTETLKFVRGFPAHKDLRERTYAATPAETGEIEPDATARGNTGN